MILEAQTMYPMPLMFLFRNGIEVGTGENYRYLLSLEIIKSKSEEELY
jgi:hypothetical protein